MPLEKYALKLFSRHKRQATAWRVSLGTQKFSFQDIMNLVPRMPRLGRKPLNLQTKNIYYTESESQNSQLNRLTIEDQNCFASPCNPHLRRLARSFKSFETLKSDQITSASRINQRTRTKRQAVTNGKLCFLFHTNYLH